MEIKPIQNPAQSSAIVSAMTVIQLEQTVSLLIIHQLKSAGLWRSDSVLNYEQDFLAMGLEQLDLFEILIKLEDTFKIEIPDDAGIYLTSVNNIVDYLAEQK